MSVGQWFELLPRYLSSPTRNASSHQAPRMIVCLTWQHLNATCFGSAKAASDGKKEQAEITLRQALTLAQKWLKYKNARETGKEREASVVVRVAVFRLLPQVWLPCGWRQALVWQESVLDEESLHVDSKEVVSKLVREPHKVPDEAAILVDEECRNPFPLKVPTHSCGRSLYDAELDLRVFFCEAAEAPVHCFTTR